MKWNKKGKKWRISRKDRKKTSLLMLKKNRKLEKKINMK